MHTLRFFRKIFDERKIEMVKSCQNIGNVKQPYWLISEWFVEEKKVYRICGDTYIYVCKANKTRESQKG